MSVLGVNQRDLEGIRLLSFDGGDIRVVSQLILLDEFMRRVEDERKSMTRILPCDYFHMIGGVGASGIVVILLAVLRMGIEETIEELIKIWNLVFIDASIDPDSRSKKLETTIGDLLIRRGMEDSQLSAMKEQETTCKAFVCTIPESNLGICEKFRTYRSKDHSVHPTIVQAIRATCAVPNLFTPVSIESIACQISYVSGSYNSNNPTWETIKEACQYFGRDRRVACVLSLGCGQRAIVQLNQNQPKSINDIITGFVSDCGRVDSDLGWRIGDLNLYYRLSVDRILEPGGKSPSSSVGDIMAYTKGFLEQHETTGKLSQCLLAAERIPSATLRDIAGLHETKPTSVYGLPSLSQFFVERPELIKTMAECLFKLGPATQRRMVLSGLGGIGKTQITVSFLLRYLSRFRHVLFIDGRSEQSIENGLIAKVKSLGATYSCSSANDALDVLANPDYEITRDWAIIYDNVDDPEIRIGRYYPSCPFGTIIVTTRNPNLGILAPKAHLKLTIMSGKEAVEALLRSAIDSSRAPTTMEQEEARKIAQDLGYLPVALIHAGYFIRAHDCMSNYRQRLKRRRPDILSRPAKYQLDAHDGLYAALNVTWLALTPRAQNFMSILGFVNYTGFPIVLLYRAVASGFSFEPFNLMDRPALFQQTIALLRATFQPREDWIEQDVDDLVAELEQYSLVSRAITFKVTTLRLHPLVHSWTQDRLEIGEKETYRAAAVRLLVCGTGAEDEGIYEFIYPHISVLSDCLGALHVNDQAGIATVMAHQGSLQSSTGLWEGIKRRVIVSHALWDLRLCEVDLQLINLYRRSGDTDKRELAVALEEVTVERCNLMLGPEHPKTLEALIQKARGMDDFELRDEARQILRSVLEAWQRQPDRNWEAILRTKEALAHFYDTEETIVIYTDVLKSRMDRCGPDHPATLNAMENLATKYQNSRDGNIDIKPEHGKSAIQTWISIVAARTISRGIDHPDTLDAKGNLAWCYQIQALYIKAVEQWKEVIRLRKAVQGVHHEKMLQAMWSLVFAYKGALQYTKAEEQMEEILQVRRELHGPGHEDALWVMRELAGMYTNSIQYTKAEEKYKEILDLTKEMHGPSHDDTLDAMGKLAYIYMESKQYTKAEEKYKEILDLTKEMHGLCHDDTLDAMGKLACMYMDSEQYTIAEEKYKEILDLTKEMHGPSHHDTLDAMGKLEEIYKSSKQYAKAEAQRKEIMRVKEILQVKLDLYYDTPRMSPGSCGSPGFGFLSELLGLGDSPDLQSDEWMDIFQTPTQSH